MSERYYYRLPTGELHSTKTASSSSSSSLSTLQFWHFPPTLRELDICIIRNTISDLLKHHLCIACGQLTQLRFLNCYDPFFEAHDYGCKTKDEVIFHRKLEESWCSALFTTNMQQSLTTLKLEMSVAMTELAYHGYFRQLSVLRNLHLQRYEPHCLIPWLVEKFVPAASRMERPSFVQTSIHSISSIIHRMIPHDWYLRFQDGMSESSDYEPSRRYRGLQVCHAGCERNANYCIHTHLETIIRENAVAFSELWPPHLTHLQLDYPGWEETQLSLMTFLSSIFGVCISGIQGMIIGVVERAQKEEVINQVQPIIDQMNQLRMKLHGSCISFRPQFQRCLSVWHHYLRM